MRFLLLLPTLMFMIACSSTSDRFDNNGRFPASANPTPDKNAKIYHVMQDRVSSKGKFLVSNVVESDLAAKDCEAKAKALTKQVKYNNYAFVVSFMDPTSNINDVVLADKDDDNDPLSKSDCSDMLEDHKLKGFSCKNISTYYCGTAGHGSMALANGEGAFSPVETQVADKTLKMTAK